MLEVANLILAVGGDATAHDVRQKARCNNCGVKGNNKYQIVWGGDNSGVAFHGAIYKVHQNISKIPACLQVLMQGLCLMIRTEGLGYR